MTTSEGPCHCNWGGASTYSEALQIIHGHGITEKVEESILKHAAVAVGEHEAITVDPVGVLGVEAHELVEEDVSHGGHAHGGTGMAGVGFEGSIDLGRLVSASNWWTEAAKVLEQGKTGGREPRSGSSGIMDRLLREDHGGQTGRGGTYRESADGVDSQLVQIRVGHDGGGTAGMMLD
jgi:hypothetical protein